MAKKLKEIFADNIILLKIIEIVSILTKLFTNYSVFLSFPELVFNWSHLTTVRTSILQQMGLRNAGHQFGRVPSNLYRFPDIHNIRKQRFNYFQDKITIHVSGLADSFLILGPYYWYAVAFSKNFIKIMSNNNFRYFYISMYFFRSI